MLKKILKRAEERELGLGSAVGTGRGERMMLPDGSMNVVRESTGLWDNIYYNLMTDSWPRFFALVFTVFGLLNIMFASLYCLIGIEHLAGIEVGGFWHNFREALFFSTQTLTTVGYGRVAPVGILTNVLSSTESLIGLLSFAIISGLVYGRFSRSQAHIVFSENMLVAPYKDGMAFMLRMVNASRSELLETEAQAILALNQQDAAGKISRRYFQLELEVGKISFFSLSWTLVHALTEKSPLFNFSQTDLLEANAEIMVLVKGVEEANEQTVHARRSYAAEEVVWNAKFTPIIGKNKRGVPKVFTSKVSEYERVAICE